MKFWTIERAAVTGDLMEAVSDFSGVRGQFKTSLVSVVFFSPVPLGESID